MPSTKKTAKKTSKRKPANATATATALPTSASVPEGFKQLGGGYAATWKPENIGDQLQGVISGEPREVEFKQGRKVVQRNVMEVTDKAGNRFAVWQSAALGALFDEVRELGADAIGVGVFLQYDGLGKKKAGQNPPKLFTVALAV